MATGSSQSPGVAHRRTAIREEALGHAVDLMTEAVRLGHLRADAGSDEAMRLWTVVLSGLITQQLANEPGATFAQGRFTALTDAAIKLFLSTYRP